VVTTKTQDSLKRHVSVNGLDRSTKQVIITVGKAAGIPLDRIHAGLAVMDAIEPRKPQIQPLLVNQAAAAKLLSVSRFTIRRLVVEGRLHPIKVRDAFRYSREELEKLAEVSIPTESMPMLTPARNGRLQSQALNRVRQVYAAIFGSAAMASRFCSESRCK